MFLLATMHAQTVSLNVTDMPLRDVLPMVEQQSDYHFFYNSSLAGLDSRVTVSLNSTPIEQALRQLFSGTGITYRITDNHVIVLTAEEKKSTTRQISGTVLDKATNEPVIGASVIIRGTTQGTITDYNGQFILDNVATGQYIECAYKGIGKHQLSSFWIPYQE